MRIKIEAVGAECGGGKLCRKVHKNNTEYYDKLPYYKARPPRGPSRSRVLSQRLGELCRWFSW